MVRGLVGSALLLSALGLASAFVGPSLSGTPAGEPMTVGGAEIAAYQEARFDSADCSSAPLLDEISSIASGANRSALALTFHEGADGVTILAGNVGAGPVQAGDAFMVVLDSSGQVRAAGSASALASKPLEHIPAGLCPGSDAERPGLI